MSKEPLPKDQSVQRKPQWSIADIANKLQVSTVTIYKHLKKDPNAPTPVHKLIIGSRSTLFYDLEEFTKWWATQKCYPSTMKREIRIHRKVDDNTA